MKDKRVAFRLGLAFSILVAILIAIGHLGLSRMDQINADLQDIIGKRRTKVRLSRDALTLSNVNSRLTLEIFLLRDPAQIQEALATRVQNSATISVLVEKLEAQSESQEETDLLAAVKRTRTPYVDSYKQALHLLVDEANREAATAIMLQETLPALHRYHAAWNQFLQFQTGQMDLAVQQSGERYARTRRLTSWLIALAIVVAAAIALFVTHDIAQEMKFRVAAQREVRRLNEELEQRVTRRTEELARAEKIAQRSLKELRAHTHEVEAASEMVELLQSCLTLEEAHSQVARCLAPFFPAGALLMVNSSRNVLELVTSWGPDPAKLGPFPPDGCWALRRGRIHLAGADHSGQVCGHLDPARVTSSLCVPMIAQGESLGVLHLQDATLSGQPEGGKAMQRRQAFALTLAEQISLALANLRLRETLKYQSVRDALTGLFNRRHMEESLERELHRARRNGKQVPVLMMDVDHFKEFNDSFGHEAGDILLREFGALIGTQIRGGDIACRYGGDEFVVILLDATLDAARQRADSLRKRVHDMQIRRRGETFRRVTVSIGMAAFPDHGTSWSQVINAADQALYMAKANGRDQVVTASTEGTAQVIESR